MSIHGHGKCFVLLPALSQSAQTQKPRDQRLEKPNIDFFAEMTQVKTTLN